MFVLVECCLGDWWIVRGKRIVTCCIFEVIIRYLSDQVIMHDTNMCSVATLLAASQGADKLVGHVLGHPGKLPSSLGAFVAS